MHKVSVLLFLCFALGLTWAATRSNSGLSSTFTADDSARLKSFLQSASVKNAHDAFYVAKGLAALDAKPSNSKDICEVVRATLQDNEALEKRDAKAIYHAAAAAQELKCDITSNKALVDSITKSLDEGETFSELANAAFAAISLHDAGVKTGIKEDDITGVVAKINELADEDGTIFNVASEKEGSLYNSGFAFQLFSRLLKDFKVSVEDTDAINNLADKAETIIDSGVEEENKLHFESEKRSNLATTSAVVRGLTAIAASLQRGIGVKALDITHLGNYLVAHKHASSAEEAYDLLTALRAVQRNTIGSPLGLVVEKGSLLATAKGAEGHVRVRVTDIFDSPVPAKVYLVKGNALVGDKAVLANQELTAEEGGAHSFNFLAAKPEQGFYGLEFRAVPTDTKKYTTIDVASRRVKVIGSVAIADFSLVVSDSRERAEGSRYKAEYPAKIDETVKADFNQHIFAQFKVKNSGGGRALLVQQAFVRLINSKTGHEAVFVATPDDNKVYTALINLEEAAKPLFKHASGEYSLEVVVGDAFIHNPIAWRAAPKLALRFDENLAASVRNPHHALSAKPEITHVFRQPEKRPSRIISDAFTLIVLSPLIILFLGLPSAGANLRRFPFSGPDFINTVAFLGSVGAILLLITLFWLRFNLVQTLGYLCVLAVPALFFGQRTLSKLASKSKLD